MAASRSSRVTRSSVGLNGLDENFCGRTLRNRSIAQPEETLVSPLPRARSPKKKQDSKQVSKQESKRDDKQESKRDDKQESKRDDKQESKRDDKQESKRDDKQESKRDDKQSDKQESKRDDKQSDKQESKRDDKQESKRDDKQESKRDDKQDDKQRFKRDSGQKSKRDDGQESKRDDGQESKRDDGQESKRDDGQESKRDDGQESKNDDGQESKNDDGQESKGDDKQNDKQESKRDDRQESKRDDRQESKRDDRQESKRDDRQESKRDDRQESKRDDRQNDKRESKRDDRQESKRDDRQESKRDDRQESKRDDRQESKRDDRQNDKRESKRDDRQESKRDDRQESKRDDRQESKRDDRQEFKHKTKQDAKEDTDNDSKQGSQLQMSLQGMLNDSKDSNSSAASEQQPSAGSRKRSGSCLEKDNSLEKSEHCGKGKGALDASPLIKRAKRCSRSVESQGRDEDAQKPASPGSNPDPHKGNSCDDIPDQNSNLAPASPVFGGEEGELAVERSKEARLKCDEASQHTNSHKTSNGLGNNIAEETCTTPTSCPPLLNGSQGGAPPSPQPTVPCTSSSPVHMEVASSEASFSPVQANPVDLFPKLIVAKEQEVEDLEVDVVGDPLCLAGEEQVTESACDTNCCLLTPEPDAAASSPSSVADANCCSTYNSNSGETTPPLAPTPPLPPHDSGWHSSVPSTPPPFTELYEHRYTLRTSPRRNATGNKATSSKACSPPPPDNGPLKEEAAGALKDNCPVVEEHALSDSVCTPKKELACAGPRDETCGEDVGPVEGKDVDAGKEATCGRTAEEDEEDDEEEPDVYYFESDHLALKHNKDYQRLLQTIGVLEAQRTQAILDLETLARHQREALTDPISFVEQLQKRVNLGLPCPQRVVQLPDVAWEQYTSGLGDFARELCDKKRKTRQLKLIFDKGLPDRPRSPIEPKKEYDSSDMYSSLPTSDGPENGSQTQIIRGRICHPNKPDTFNQLWTVEEQKKLELLLLKFPPEEVESKRWQKIADELGNRTAKQVASRVQKYFIKLTKAGIPVPGRTPNLCMYTKKASSKRQHHLNKHLYRPSTFLTSYEPPVYMDDEDERSVYYSSMQDASADDSDEDGVPAELRNLPEYKELLELKRLKKRKIQEIHEDKAAVRHIGFKCDMCGMEPIQGVRWHCRDCPQDNSVDFCSNCSDCLLKTDTHVPDHRLEAVYQADTFLDRDYCLPQSTSYNYLDPNYFPANR
ncbi:ZZ-type zinc finger-containing protein 3 isoform X2 [Nerophis lumbriciformis]|uniref:ZZ-type zinc finger-containing protein 3 isoform X2 n=1 Tax=Nerophis lumbriciformis TaxID=546530 RepID=UPI003BAC8915